MRLPRLLLGLGVCLVVCDRPIFTADAASPPTAYPHGTPYCPSGPAAPAPAAPAAPQQPGQLRPEEPRPAPPADTTTAPDTDAFSQAPPAGTGGDTGSFAPNMLGDSPGAGCGTVLFEGRIAASLNHPGFSCSRSKITENNSPMPRDRAYFTYQLFHNQTDLFLANTDTGQTFATSLSVHQYTFGLEETLLDGWMSFELRVPVSTQLTNSMLVNSNVPSISDGLVTDWGNLAVIWKTLLCDRENFKLSGGLLVHVPTAPDITVHDVENDDGTLINNTYRVRNREVVLSPYFGALLTPSDRCFLQGFVQFDFPMSYPRVDVYPARNGGVQPAFSLSVQDQTLLRVDVGAGYWLYRGYGDSFITGIAPVAELHYTTSLQNARLIQFDRGVDNPVILGNTAGRVDIWNLLLGGTVEINNTATLAVGAVIPLSTGDNKPFDFEVNVQLNYRFGPAAAY